MILVYADYAFAGRSKSAVYTVMNHGQVYFLLSDTAEPALHFIVPAPLCAEPQGKNGLAHVSEHVILSLIEARLTEVMTGSFGFYAHTGFSGIQFHFRHLKTEENIRIVYRAIQESLYPSAIPGAVLKTAKAHVLKECRELKQFYAQVLKQTRFLTGCKSITMPVGKVKEVQSITEQDVLQFIRDRYGEHTFIIVGNRLDSSISEDTRTAELVRQTRCVFEKTRRKRHKPFLHTALPSCAVQTVSLCIHVDNDRAAGNYFVLTALHLYIIECMNAFFQRKGMHDDACGDARTTMQKVDSETIVSFLTFQAHGFRFESVAGELKRFIIRQTPCVQDLENVKQLLADSLTAGAGLRTLVSNIIMHIEHGFPLIINPQQRESAKEEIKAIPFAVFADFKRSMVTKEHFHIIIKDTPASQGNIKERT